MWMNEHDIERMVFVAEQDAPEILPFAKYLADWVDIVNGNSDGWPYWKPASSCAGKLMELLNEARTSLRTRGELPPRELFVKSLSPIKRFATTKGIPQPDLAEPEAPAPRAPGF